MTITRLQWYPLIVDLSERYYQLSLLGRETFLDSVAAGVLLRKREAMRMARGTSPVHPRLDLDNPTSEFSWEDLAYSPLSLPLREFLLTPLIKKVGTPFIDLVTIGRTPSNDIILDDICVSRFQAFFRYRLHHWFLCDAGSRNGTRLNDVRLTPRTERKMKSGDVLRFGTVTATFYSADSLFDILVHHRETREQPDLQIQGHHRPPSRRFPSESE